MIMVLARVLGFPGSRIMAILLYIIHMPRFVNIMSKLFTRACMCKGISVYIHYAYTYIYIYIYIYICTYIYIHTHIYIYTHVRECVYGLMYLLIC